MDGIRGKRVIVSGAARGIGAATVERLAAAGARVLVGDADLDAVTAIAEQISGSGGEAHPVRLDLADEQSVRDLPAAAVSAFGGLDALANVGADLSETSLGRHVDLLQIDTTMWEQALRANLVGYAHACRVVLPCLVERGGGAIVNATSGAAALGEITRPAFAASEAGVATLTRHIARRWGRDGVRCNAVMPGQVMTEQAQADSDREMVSRMLARTALERLGRPGDVANVIVFLLSDDASWVTGQVWSVNGGEMPHVALVPGDGP